VTTKNTNTDERHLLRDVRLELRDARARAVYAVATDRRRAPRVQGFVHDLGTIDGADNLRQAVVMRLLTPRGELAPLGHPEYGSRLPDLVGEVNTETTRNRIRLAVLEALAQEQRIQEVTEVAVQPVPGRRHDVAIRLVVTPVGLSTPIVIGPFVLELEQ
jgi:phage baseplate assembly protein W